MNAASFLSYACIVAALVVMALYIQRMRRRKVQHLSDFLTVAALWYMTIIYVMAVLPEPGYAVRSGVLSRVGFLILLFVLALRSRNHDTD